MNVLKKLIDAMKEVLMDLLKLKMELWLVLDKMEILKFGMFKK